MNINNSITFRNLTNTLNDYKLLYNWCRNKDVYEWFEQRILSLEEIKNKYKNKLSNKLQELYIIESNNIEIGLVQIYKYENNIKLNLDKYKNIYEYDLFIGDSHYLNKGIGKLVVNKINDLIYDKYHADAIILRPFKRNIRAIKCYKKCGFESIYEYVDTDTIGNKESVVVFLNIIHKNK